MKKHRLSATVVVLLLSTLFVACDHRGEGSPPTPDRKGKTTHSSSAKYPALTEKQRFLERYVTFKRSYERLEFKIDYEDDTSLVPGPSSTGCDIRLYAKVPSAQASQWTDGLEPWPSPVGLEWTADIPNAPKALEGFVWYQDHAVGGGGRVVGVAKASSEILYRLVCSRN